MGTFQLNKLFHRIGHRRAGTGAARSKPAAGFSLIEAILAIGVTAIGLLGVASLMTSIIATGQLNNARDNAVAAATRKMEYLLSPQLSADSVDLTEGHHQDSTPILGDNQAPYLIAWDISQDPLSGALSISITASYTLSGAAGNGAGTVRTVQLSSMRF